MIEPAEPLERSERCDTYRWIAARHTGGGHGDVAEVTGNGHVTCRRRGRHAASDAPVASVGEADIIP